MPRSGLAIASFVLALVGTVIGLFPFAGFLGTIGLFLAIADKVRKDPPDRPRRHGFSTAGLVLGLVSTAGAVLWVIIFSALSSASSHGSCPHIYAFDGKAYRLDADPVSGALYAGAERDDLDRLESLQETDGRYRVRVQDDLEEIDHVDSVELLAVDHAPGGEVLPTQDGRVIPVRSAAAPLRAVDDAGEDVRARLSDEDGVMVSGELRGGADPRIAWTLDFPRPTTRRAVLVVRGHNTRFAEDAFVRYLAEMGQGLRPVLEWAQQRDCACYKRYMQEEIARLGLPLDVEVAAAGGAFERAETLQPVGPAIPRSQAVVIDLPPGDGDVRVRLGATPRFWEIDAVSLAPYVDEPLTTERLTAATARASSGADVTSAMARSDGDRVALRHGEHVDLEFVAPPLAPGRERTVIAQLRGYYELGIGGRPGVNTFAMLLHNLGWMTLPRYAVTLASR